MIGGAKVRGCEGARVRFTFAPSHLRTLAPLLLVLCSSPAFAQTRGLSSPQQIARAYDAIFDGRFDDVQGVLSQTCPPVPVAACEVLDALSIWWQIQLDPFNTTRDAMFQSHVDAAIGAAEAWTQREPRRAEAWFYLGGAYGTRVQWRVLRGERLAAARDGKRIKDALEQALALDPGMQDAYFGIGLYHYYADVAPTAAKMLRWLLFLPGGDKTTGMQEMLRARDNGTVLRDEADYQLHVLDLWYEKQPERAIELLQGLRARHPRNPHFPQLIAEVQDVYLHDLTESLRSWRALLDAARSRRVVNAAMAETQAHLGIASILDRLYESDEALEHVRAVIAARPPAPFGAMAQAHLQLGVILDHLGPRNEAVAAYRAALAATPASDPLKIGDRARAGLRITPSVTEVNAYRLSLQGWRAFERGAMDEAARTLGEALMLRPTDTVAQYRHARVLEAQKNFTGALTLLDNVSRAPMVTPPTIFAAACVEAARLHEQQGSRDRAIELYDVARSVFGADRVTKDAAERAYQRLTASSQTR